MRLAVTIGGLAALAAGLLHAPPAGASCVSSVVVGGYVQYGQDPHGLELPPADGTVGAVFPACNDAGQDDPDQRGKVTRLQGVPPTVATRDEDTVYIGSGQMTALGDHPVHTPTRGRRDCRPGPTVRRRAATGFGSTVLGKGREIVRIDARTRLTNATPTTPVVSGQRFRATTSRCAGRAVADELAFAPPILPQERYEPSDRDRGSAGVPRWAGLLLLLGIAAAIPVLVVIVVVSSGSREER